MKKHNRSTGVSLVLYAVVAILVTATWLFFRGESDTESTGTLDGRFDSEITCEIDGTTCYYREAVLTNLLLIGTDSQGTAATTAQEGGQADFLLLLTADRENRRLTLTHIDRDTMTEIQTYGIFGDPAGSITTQICLSHAFGTTEEQQCENTVAAVRDLFGGILIDGYIAVDIADIADLNEALGGVTVTLEDDFSREDASMVPGETVTLTGKQAEIFLRYRSTVADGTNTNRMKRQRTYMTAALEILESGDAEVLEKLLGVLEADACTNLNQQYLTMCYDRWSQYTLDEIQTMEGRHTVGEDGFVSFYLDENWMNQYLLNHFFR